MFAAAPRGAALPACRRSSPLAAVLRLLVDLGAVLGEHLQPLAAPRHGVPVAFARRPLDRRRLLLAAPLGRVRLRQLVVEARRAAPVPRLAGIAQKLVNSLTTERHLRHLRARRVHRVAAARARVAGDERPGREQPCGHRRAEPFVHVVFHAVFRCPVSLLW